jgi:hypothetical protein
MFGDEMGLFRTATGLSRGAHLPNLEQPPAGCAAEHGETESRRERMTQAHWHQRDPLPLATRMITSPWLSLRPSDGRCAEPVDAPLHGFVRFMRI